MNSPSEEYISQRSGPPQAELLSLLGLAAESVGVIVVDHGSKRDESNQLLLQVAARFQQTFAWQIVEPAHMELSEPSIATAFDRVVQRGARLVVVHPYFLAPGNHWRHDIPQLAAAAAARHPGVQYVVTAPLGLHPLMQQVMQDRVVQCLRRTLAGGDPCDVCAAETGCRLQSAPP
jgi:sirohydrochlorin ferrochelatase